MLILLALLMTPCAVVAHGSVSLEDDLCAIEIGYFRAHFKIYLPQKKGHRDYCEDLPAAGDSVFVMEYVHRGLGEIPIDFRIIRNVTDMGQFARLEDVEAIDDLDAVTEFYQPATVSPDVFTIAHRFAEPGGYIGIVRTLPEPGGPAYAAVFPFKVGFTGFGYWPLVVLIALLLQLNYLYMSGRFSLRKPRRLQVVGSGSASAALISLGLALSLNYGAVATAHADEASWPSTDGRYELSFSSELEPIPINQLHRWTLTVRDQDGEPVDGAVITVDGGMPLHNHGLPTRPRVTRSLGAGRYLLEGMRFHMQGRWELLIVIDSENGTDTVPVTLDL